MLSPDKPIIAEPAAPRFRTHGFSGAQIGVLFAAFTLLISIPIWTHPLPPLSDYVNHLSRMQVMATLAWARADSMATASAIHGPMNGRYATIRLS